MKRRAALKNMALAAGAFMVLPACETGGRKLEVLSAEAYLSPRQDEILAEIVDTIIPATDTPGAKEMNVQSFVKIMMKDCYDDDAQKNFTDGLDMVEKLSRKTYGRSFKRCSGSEKSNILLLIEQSDESKYQHFFHTIKGLTVRGYMSSEYVMTHINPYEMLPGHYHGCVPVNVEKHS